MIKSPGKALDLDEESSTVSSDTDSEAPPINNILYNVSLSLSLSLYIYIYV